MEHLSEEKLKKYAKRELSAAEMTVAILHLEDCSACFENLNEILATPTATEDSSAFFNETAEQFHLDFDEHLRPFVDKEADEVTREIVENHTQSCAMCARELRDLREFSASLRMREIEKAAASKSSFGGSIRRFLKSRFARTALAVSILSVFIIGGIFWLNRGKQSLSDEIRSPEISQIQTPLTNKNVEIPSPKPELSNADLQSETANRKVEVAKTPLNLNNQTPESLTKQEENNDLAELQNLPSNIRAKVQTVWQTNKLEFPQFLASLRENPKLRGESGELQSVIYPNGEAIRETAPKFSWRKFAASDETYVIEILDENNNSVFTSESLNQTKFKLPINLRRGEIYQWEVRSVKNENSPKIKSVSGKFKIVEQKTLNDLENLSSSLPIVRGIILAKAGLLTEAKQEFRRSITRNENVKKAKRFLRQIDSLK